jgi:16S rRNA (guanine527-N7)-methyltransferase
LGLRNVRCIKERIEEEKGQFDFVISRAVMPMGDLVKLVRKNVSHKHNNAMPNGLMVLKGGKLEGELHEFKKIRRTNTYYRFLPRRVVQREICDIFTVVKFRSSEVQKFRRR